MWLSIETSSRRVSLALGENETFHREVSREGNASSLVETLYRELDVDFSKVDRCAIGQGPGSYNGLRVGYAFLKGLLCLDPRPVAQIPSPLTLAMQAVAQMGSLKASPPTFLVLNNARRDEIYGALVVIRDGLPHLEWQLTAAEKIIREKIPSRLDAVVSHDYTEGDLPGFAAYRSMMLFPSAATAAMLAGLLNAPASADLSRLEPHYVRPPVPEKSA